MAFAFVQLLIAQNNPCIVSIPDANFKNALMSHYPSIDYNADGEIQCSEAEAFTGTIDVVSKNISDLTGIEAFINITGLKCGYNQITFLDVSANTALTTLGCWSNQLTSLDVSLNTALTHLICQNNPLGTLDVSANTALIELSCSANELTSLDVSANTALQILGCVWNDLTSLDLSTNTALYTLSCMGNDLTSLDLSTNTALQYLDCRDNLLTNLDLSTNTALLNLDCSGNQLANLDLNVNTALQRVVCYQNQLASLNIANGNNGIMQRVNVLDNPNLICIQVDDADYSNTNWINEDFFKKPAGTSWSENCALGTSDFETFKVAIYPNPTNGIVNLSEKANITVFDMQGRKIAESKNTTSFDLSSQTAGIYLAKITTEKGIEMFKIVKN